MEQNVFTEETLGDFDLPVVVLKDVKIYDGRFPTLNH